MRTFVACTALIVWTAGPASAQHITGELAATAGVSTDDVSAAATQARVFGDVKGVSFFAEGAWAASTEREDGRHSEAFSTAYPYEGPPRIMEAYAERHFDGRKVFTAVRAGRFRTPFGIHDASDHAYNGFLRAPLMRYEGYWSLTNTLFEHGVNVMAGTSRVQGEVTVGRPGDASDDFTRRAGADIVLRGQTYVGPFVIGVSHLRSQAYDLEWAAGRMVFTGVDVRWMRGGVQVRGEWMAGRPWDGTSTTGGYVDLIVHRPFMGPVTLVGRVETLDYDVPDPAWSDAADGITLGARVRLGGGLYAQANVTHRPSEPYGRNATATDVALTYSVRTRK